MSFEHNGTVYETNEKGYLIDVEKWNRDVAALIAAEEEIELTDRHFDVLEYLRSEYINNHGSQPNERKMVKAFGDMWGEKINSKVLYGLFPKGPAKQASKVAGLPETKRKGGY